MPTDVFNNLIIEQEMKLSNAVIKTSTISASHKMMVLSPTKQLNTMKKIIYLAVIILIGKIKERAKRT